MNASHPCFLFRKAHPLAHSDDESSYLGADAVQIPDDAKSQPQRCVTTPQGRDK